MIRLKIQNSIALASLLIDLGITNYIYKGLTAIIEKHM